MPFAPISQIREIGSVVSLTPQDTNEIIQKLKNTAFFMVI